MVPIDTRQAFDYVLVIGGGESLGHIVFSELYDGYDCRIAVFDLDLSRNERKALRGIRYYRGDISLIEEILPAFQESKPSVVIYVLPASKGDESANIARIRTVIQACTETGVKGLVYSSTASAEGEDIILAANRSPSLLTVVLRPKGVFSTDIDDLDGDAQTVAARYAAHGHCLAACALLSASKLDTIPPEDDRIDGNVFVVTNTSARDTWTYNKLI